MQRRPLLLIPAAVAVALFFGLSGVERVANPPAGAPGGGPRFEIRALGIDTVGYDPDGGVRYTLQARSQTRFSDTVTELERPLMGIYRSAESHWDIKAAAGVIMPIAAAGSRIRAGRRSGGGGHRITLSGAVDARSLDGFGRAIELQASRALIQITDEYGRLLEMADNVALQRGGLQVRGERAVFEYDDADGALQRLTVTGSPLQYRVRGGDSADPSPPTNSTAGDALVSLAPPQGGSDSDTGTSDDEDTFGTADLLELYEDSANGEAVFDLRGDAVIQSPDTDMRCAAIVYGVDSNLIRETVGPCSGLHRD